MRPAPPLCLLRAGWANCHERLGAEQQDGNEHDSATEYGSAHEEGMGAVVAMLIRAKLAQYAETLEDLGFDDLPFLCTRKREQLEEIAAHARMKAGHTARFLKEMREEGALC